MLVSFLILSDTLHVPPIIFNRRQDSYIIKLFLLARTLTEFSAFNLGWNNFYSCYGYKHFITY
jgi:hypothetical protein